VQSPSVTRGKRGKRCVKERYKRGGQTKQGRGDTKGLGGPSGTSKSPIRVEEPRRDLYTSWTADKDQIYLEGKKPGRKGGDKSTFARKQKSRKGKARPKRVPTGKH